MRQRLESFSTAILLAIAACGEPLPPPGSDTLPTVPPNFVDGDSIEISAPGQGRMQLWISDTAGYAITTTGPLTASFEVTGFNVRSRILVIDASAAGTGVVKVTRSGASDSVKVVATAVSFKSVSVTNGHACGLAADGRAWCWGANGSRQIGAATPHPCYGGGCQYGDGGSAKLPLPVAGNRTFASVATSGRTCTLSGMIGACGSSCAITSQGDAWCWGAAAGPGNVAPMRFGPDRQLSTIVTAVSGSSGFDLTTSVCGLTNQGEAYCLTPAGSTRVGGAMTFTSFGTAATHSCGISAGDVYCWGSNSQGALGIGSTDTQAHAAPERAVASASFTSVAVGENQTCALSTARQVYCWGRGSGTPQPVTGGGTYDSFSLSTAVVALCAATASGAVDCWTSFTSAPTTVQAPIALKGISVGGKVTLMSAPIDAPFGCGLSPSNDAYCWTSDLIARKVGSP